MTRNILWQKTSKLWLLLNRKKLMENLGINVICAFLEILARLVLYYFHFSSNSLKLLLWYWWNKSLYSICAFCFSLVFTLLFMCIKIKVFCFMGFTLSIFVFLHYITLCKLKKSLELFYFHLEGKIAHLEYLSSI